MAVVNVDRRSVGGDSIHVDHRLASLAAAQRSLVTHAQLLAAGFSARQIERRVEGGRLHPVHRGVYAVGHPVLPPLGAEQAALLAIGPHAALSHRSAAVVWGLLPPLPGPVDVLHWPPHRRTRPGIRLHRTFTAPPTRVHQRLRVTTPADTLVALTGAVDSGTLARAIQEAQTRRLVPKPRDGYTRSEAERRLLRLIDDAHLPRPRTNAFAAGHEVDTLWPEHRLIAEVDGFAFHHTRAAFEHDRARDADLILAGYTVLRITWRQLTEEPHAVVARLAGALAVTARA